MAPRILTFITVLCLCGAIAIWVQPFHSKLFNLVLVGFIFGAWLGMLLLFWKRKLTRRAFLTFPALIILPFLFPGQPLDRERLRKAYVERLVKLDGVSYVWGGEKTLGIDCSGLPRNAFRSALLATGLGSVNGNATRAALEQWWFDASAKALGEGYRGYTVTLPPEGTIREMDYSSLLPGDLAITKSGSHALVYLGEERWIQADPGVGEVKIFNGRTDVNSWLTTPVRTVRWTLL